MQLARTRSLFSLAFLACASMVGAAVYLGFVIDAAPCPMCLIQRVLMALSATVCLFAALHAPGRRGWRVYAGILLLFSALGAGVAARQVWLQASPPENMAACLENLHYLLETQTYLKVLAMVLAGSAGCSEINWSLFGISLPEWSLLAFSGLCLFALYYLFIEFRRFRSMDVGTSD
ncbi:disulfide bond formation protein B [Pseudomonas lutea]|uniref:Disulfide bond formation protein B n=1 Tax=Pseudomonas lutea TaxID=243924 RepID=A0A9X0EE69_9PSED|nr:disulfide bond formation protein B [Pseudomonas lutea]KGF64166.1 disulfide bond formation protein DsbB [Pseudomonas lutea]